MTTRNFEKSSVVIQNFMSSQAFKCRQNDDISANLETLIRSHCNGLYYSRIINWKAADIFWGTFYHIYMLPKIVVSREIYHAEITSQVVSRQLSLNTSMVNDDAISQRGCNMCPQKPCSRTLKIKKQQIFYRTYIIYRTVLVV